jgi:hypothetical protein
MSNFLSAGGHIQRLAGQANYRRWAREFRLLAQSKCLWSYFMTEDHKVPVTGLARFDANGRLFFNLHGISKTQAMQLLMFCVDPAIRGELEQFFVHPTYNTDPLRTRSEGYPHAAWKYLEYQYMMTVELTISLAAAKMDALYLPDFANVTTYLNEFKLLSQDIIDAGGKIDEWALTPKIVAGLSPEYSAYLQENKLSNHPLKVTLRSLMTGLLQFEANLQVKERKQKIMEAFHSDRGRDGAGRE